MRHIPEKMLTIEGRLAVHKAMGDCSTAQEWFKWAWCLLEEDLGLPTPAFNQTEKA